jgi:hypothetical protein
MAAVYLAQDLKHDRRVVVKVLRPEFSTSVEADSLVAQDPNCRVTHPQGRPRRWGRGFLGGE